MSVYGLSFLLFLKQSGPNLLLVMTEAQHCKPAQADLLLQAAQIPTTLEPADTQEGAVSPAAVPLHRAGAAFPDGRGDSAFRPSFYFVLLRRSVLGELPTLQTND